MGYFKQSRVEIPVISVGNITWGGTGKTPLVEALITYLKQKGYRPAILMRGYGRDESEMLKRRHKDVPVICGRDRIKSARLAKDKYNADVLVLDDGFQHWRLWRDLDIVLVDGYAPFGNKHIIPAGELREPLSSLARADILLITHANTCNANLGKIKNSLRRFNSNALIFEATHMPIELVNVLTEQTLPVSSLRNKKVAVLAAIAKPESFEDTLKKLGAQIVISFYYPDHFDYTERELEKIEKQCLGAKIDTLITTEKDAPKLTPLLKKRRCWVDVMALRILFSVVDEEKVFFKHIEREVSKKKPYSVLILSDGKAGHLNQSRAIATIIENIKGERNECVEIQSVDIQFKSKLAALALRFWAGVSSSRCVQCLRCVRFSLKEDSWRRLYKGSYDIIISAGASVSPLSHFLSLKNGVKKISLMRPSSPGAKKYDLIIVPEHDRVKKAPNIITTLLTPNLVTAAYLKKQGELLRKRFHLSASRGITGSPAVALLLGGNTPTYKLDESLANVIIKELKNICQNLNAQLYITSSRRTPKSVDTLLRNNFLGYFGCKLLVIANEDNFPETVGGILDSCDIALVSGESISMVSEAVSSGKYVLVFNLEKKVRGETKQERFLKALEDKGLIKVLELKDIQDEIQTIWRSKPERKRPEDEAKITKALEEIL